MPSPPETTSSNPFRAAAVLVTYNRKELLVECLDALLRQSRPLDRIIVIDNASTDGTPEHLKQLGYLEKPIIDYTRMPQNTGGAGGFHEGVKRGYKAGYQWLWLMDDDVEPTPDALETMLSYSHVSKCLQAARIYADGQPHPWEQWVNIDRSGRRSASQEKLDGDYITVQVACFEGMLINRDIITKIGFPDKRFFIGGDDTAYGYLASKQTENIYINKPCFIKKIRKPVSLHESFFVRIFNRFRVQRPTRFYFLSIRNELLLRRYLGDAVEPIRFYWRVSCVLLKHCVTTLVCERSRQNFAALWRGVFEGMSLKVPPPQDAPETEEAPEPIDSPQPAMRR